MLPGSALRPHPGQTPGASAPSPRAHEAGSQGRRPRVTVFHKVVTAGPVLDPRAGWGGEGAGAGGGHTVLTGSHRDARGPAGQHAWARAWAEATVTGGAPSRAGGRSCRGSFTCSGPWRKLLENSH